MWGRLKCLYLTFFSMYSTSDGRWEFCTSNSVRSASSRQGGGSLGCRAVGSLRIRRILTHTHTHFNLIFFYRQHSGSLTLLRSVIWLLQQHDKIVSLLTHLRAIVRTLALFLARGREEEFVLGVEAEDRVCTYSSRMQKKHVDVLSSDKILQATKHFVIIIILMTVMSGFDRFSMMFWGGKNDLLDWNHCDILYYLYSHWVWCKLTTQNYSNNFFVILRKSLEI